jgi:hypothetical protein
LWKLTAQQQLPQSLKRSLPVYFHDTNNHYSICHSSLAVLRELSWNAVLSSGRARRIGAEYSCEVYGGPPSVVGEYAKRSMSGPMFSLQAHLTMVECRATYRVTVAKNDTIGGIV